MMMVGVKLMERIVMDVKQNITDCATMSDEELVRVMTLDKADYTERSLQLVTREMVRRKFQKVFIFPLVFHQIFSYVA